MASELNDPLRFFKFFFYSFCAVLRILGEINIISTGVREQGDLWEIAACLALVGSWFYSCLILLLDWLLI